MIDDLKYMLLGAAIGLSAYGVYGFLMLLEHFG